jgi:hypothetical protein
MYFIGVDHHKQGSVMTILDEDGRESRDEPSARHSPVAYIHGRVRRKCPPG